MKLNDENLLVVVVGVVFKMKIKNEMKENKKKRKLID